MTGRGLTTHSPWQRSLETESAVFRSCAATFRAAVFWVVVVVERTAFAMHMCCVLQLQCLRCAHSIASTLFPPAAQFVLLPSPMGQ